MKDMKSTLQRIEEIKSTGYRLDLGEAINGIFNNYKKIALLGGALILLIAVVALVVFGGLAALVIGLDTFTKSITDFGGGVLSSTALIINFAVTVTVTAFFAPIAAGLVQMAHNAEINEEFDFGTAFMHYKSAYFKEIFFGAAIIAVVGTGFTTLVEIIKLSYPEGSLLDVITLITSLISVLIQFFTLAMIPLIIFGKLNAIDAIKGSFVLISKNLWTIALLAIVVFIFIMFGLIAFCIGIIFTLPALYSLQYIVYKTALPIEKHNELDEIGQNRF
jgi:hypothetical protein